MPGHESKPILTLSYSVARAQVQGVVVVRGDFCSGGVQAYTARVTFAMMAPLRSFAEGVPHGRY
jgi:hypothetical protein